MIGVSLGGAAALLASPLNIDALVIESVFPNITDAIHNRVAAQIGLLETIPSALLLIQLELRLGISPSELCPIDHLPDVGCPVYILSGNEDQQTTPAETKQMYSAAPEPKEIWLVNDAAHVDLYHSNPIEYRQRIGDFLDINFHIKQANIEKRN